MKIQQQSFREKKNFIKLNKLEKFDSSLITNQ